MIARRSFLLVVAAAVAAGCGSDPGGPAGDTVAGPARNVLPIVVSSGVNGDYVDGVFTSVTVCMPGTSTCQVIDNVLVDTGSIGLRLLASGPAGGALTLPLPQQTDATGSPVAECVQFADGYTWGPIRSADIRLAGEQAGNVPVQVIGDAAFESMVPAGCTNTGLAAEDTIHTLDANGILGVGPWRQDCGDSCAASTSPGLYYSCPQGGCRPALQDLTAQVQNPVWLFSGDNNGVIVELPSVSAAGSPSVTGSLVFGIGTQPNNGLNGATVLALDGYGNFTATSAGNAYPQSFIDSGSNAFYFPSAGTNLTVCSDNKDWYCPATQQAFSATNTGSSNGSVPVHAAAAQFTVANADALSASNVAFDDLAGPDPTGFDYGLPFFFGRNVFTAIEQQGTPAGPGPWFAY